MNRIAIALLILTTITCGSGRTGKSAPGRTPGHRSVTVDLGISPDLTLFAVGYAKRLMDLEPAKYTSLQKSHTRQVCYDTAYRYCLMNGMSTSGAAKYATAYTADPMTVPEPVCADYAEPPSRCRAQTVPHGASFPK
jgi:hypothetical protein